MNRPLLGALKSRRGGTREKRESRPVEDPSLTRRVAMRLGADFLDPRAATATTRARARTRTVSSADRARARRGVVRRRDAGASNVDRKPYFLGFRIHGASSRRGSIRRRFSTFLSKFERFSSRFGVATRVKVQIDVTACDVVHRLVSTVRPLERRRRARDSR